MIVKNEEETLARCLDSVQGIADEIIITDTGSTDRTLEIAYQYTERVFTFPWVNDFSAARNAGLNQASMDFILWLDADDVIPPASRTALMALKKGLTPDVSVVMLPYHVAFDESGAPTLTYYRERLIRNHQGFFFQGAVHEAITPKGHIIWRNIPIEHRKLHPSAPGRNLAILQARRAAGLPFDPRQQYYYGRELFDHGRYEEAAQALAAFLDEGKGWVENNIEACYLLSQCYTCLCEDQPALEALFQSFAHGLPRPEGLCRIGEWFLNRARYQEAIYWYQQALACPLPDGAGFTQPEFEGYIPCLQLCVCYDRLGQYELAAEYNRRAGEYRPASQAYLQNKAYFEARLEGGAHEPV
ncbi:MAG: glycosyltransferase [Clostridia bacterium]|nr:glycosyltransferase [Clostridia bacterium]